MSVSRALEAIYPYQGPLETMFPYQGPLEAKQIRKVLMVFDPRELTTRHHQFLSIYSV